MRNIAKILLTFALIATLTSCVFDPLSNTEMTFSFDTSEEVDSYKEKYIYINDALDKMVLDAELKIDSGEAVVTVRDNASEENVWENTYTADADFTIELFDLKEDSRYIICVQTTQCKSFGLKIKTSESLVKEKEKPDLKNLNKK